MLTIIFAFSFGLPVHTLSTWKQIISDRNYDTFLLYRNFRMNLVLLMSHVRSANVAQSKCTVSYISKGKLEINRSVLLRCLGTRHTYRAAAFIYCSSFFYCGAGCKKCYQEGRSSSSDPGSNGATIITDARLVFFSATLQSCNNCWNYAAWIR